MDRRSRDEKKDEADLFGDPPHPCRPGKGRGLDYCAPTLLLLDDPAGHEATGHH